jgi:hypothetical protein
LIHLTDNLVGQNNTIAEIEQQVDAMCALLPSPINGAVCFSFCDLNFFHY